MNRAFLLLGSNVDKESNIPDAIIRLKKATQVVAISAVYETDPVGEIAQPMFWNVAAIICTDKTAEALKKDVLRPIETAMRRVRTVDPNARRTIDIDILMFNEAIMDNELREYPHIAVPMSEIAEAYSPQAARLLREITGTFSSAQRRAVRKSVQSLLPDY